MIFFHKVDHPGKAPAPSRFIVSKFDLEVAEVGHGRHSADVKEKSGLASHVPPIGEGPTPLGKAEGFHDTPEVIASSKNVRLAAVLRDVAEADHGGIDVIGRRRDSFGNHLKVLLVHVHLTTKLCTSSIRLQILSYNMQWQERAGFKLT